MCKKGAIEQPYGAVSRRIRITPETLSLGTLGGPVPLSSGGIPHPSAIGHSRSGSRAAADAPGNAALNSRANETACGRQYIAMVALNSA